MDSVSIGNKLRELRENAGLSAKEVADILQDRYGIEMNHRTLFNYEKGRSSPDIDRFLVLCMVYGCSDVLFEFGYTQRKTAHPVQSHEDSEIIKKYHELSKEGQDVIRGALGMEKREISKMEGIS